MWFLVRKEMAQQMITAKFAVMTLLVVVLTVLSLMVMHRDYELRLDSYELLKPSGHDTVAMKRPEPMSILVRGLDERMGRSVAVEGLGWLTVGTSQGAANRLFSLFRDVDFHFIVAVIMSLAAVLFTFDMISGEKRQGTLKLMSANGMSRNRILASKWLAAMLVVGLPVLMALLITVLYVQFLAPAAAGGDLYLRMVAFAISIFLYLAVFISLGLLISSLTHKPSISLVLAILIWTLLVFVIPNAAAQGANNLAGGESLDQMESRVRALWTSEVFKRNNSEGPRDFDAFAHGTGNRLANLYIEFINSSQEKLDWLGRLSTLTPAGPFNFLAWGCAGTGPIDSLRFKTDVVRYQGRATDDAIALRDLQRNDPDRLKDLETTRFSYRPRSLIEALQREMLPAAAVLAVMVIALYLAAFIAFIRYDVR